jgi:hypothetical protein
MPDYNKNVQKGLLIKFFEIHKFDMGHAAAEHFAKLRYRNWHASEFFVGK